MVSTTTCQPDPNGLFDAETCDPNFDDDGIFPDAVQVSLNSTGGVTGNLLLANLTFEAVETPGSYTWLDLLLAEFLYPGGLAIPALSFDGMICLAPCENFKFLPLVGGDKVEIKTGVSYRGTTCFCNEGTLVTVI